MASGASKEDKKQTGTEKSNPTKKPSLNMDELRELADLVDERGFTDFEFENEKIRVRLSKSPIGNAPQAVQTPIQVNPSLEPVADTVSDTADDSNEADDGLHKITSPIVGTLYWSPAPDKPPFVKEGDVVSPDTIVCIVEAMKLMNEIQAEASGEIVKIYAEDAQPVEFGQPLFGIKK